MELIPQIFHLNAKRFFEVSHSDTGSLLPCGLRQEAQDFNRRLLKGDLSIVRYNPEGELSFEYRRRKKVKK